MPAKAIMIQGTGSDVGKSLLTAALCRIFAQDGFRVRPFKAQNMSNNADVTPDGGEIGRAQAEQARACGVEPSVLMNPILLKPTTDVGAQVVVLGQAVRTMAAREYQAFKPSVRATIRQALAELREQADLVVIEGAGSPAEINLKDHDLVNMWVANEANAAVLLVGDIDRGGVFAQLVGTMELLDQDERARVRGFVINKFRGDASLLTSGLTWLEARYGRPVVGTIPYFQDVELAAEDSLPASISNVPASEEALRIEVIRLPRISNFTDFDPLTREPDVSLRYIDRPTDGNLPDALIVPGSKSTIADLEFMRSRGLAAYLRRCVDSGAEVLGICGGFQMLGERLEDPDHVESPDASVEGLGFLPATTRFEREKTVTRVRGRHLESGLPVEGYEIHMGRLIESRTHDAVFEVTERGGRPDGSHDGLQDAKAQVWGTYLHGLFAADAWRRWWLNRLRARRGLPVKAAQATGSSDGVYDRLAAAVRPHLDMRAIYQMLER